MQLPSIRPLSPRPHDLFYRGGLTLHAVITRSRMSEKPISLLQQMVSAASLNAWPTDQNNQTKPNQTKPNQTKPNQTKIPLDWQGEGSLSNGVSQPPTVLLSGLLFCSSKLKPREACFLCRAERSAADPGSPLCPWLCWWEVSGINGQNS